MNELLITKQGLGQQDIIFGKGDITQERNGELYNISKVSIIYPCSSVDELKELDTDKFVTALVYSDDNSNLYRFDVNSQEAESLPDVIESNTTNLGRWVLIELGLKGDFVTRNTPQTVLIGADKVWENNNTFSGNSEFGQFTIKPTLDANVLKFTFLDVAGAERSSIGYTKVDDINLTFENKIESGEFDFNSSLNIVAENNQNIQFCTPVQDNDPNVLTTIGYKADDLTFFVFESNDGTTFKFNQQISMSDNKIVDVATCTDALDAANKQYVDDQDNLLSDKIAVNAQNIATNAQNIATNTTNIATNAQNIVDTNTRVDNLEDFMNQHLGASVIIGQIQKTKDEVETDRATILDDFVQQQKSRQPKEGDSIYTTDNYAYYYSDSWSNPYTISINIATTTTAGLVLSSEDIAGNKGKIAVNPLDGSMSVLGWNDVYDVATDPNLAYLNKVQTFTANQTFDSSVYVGTDQRDRSLSVRGNVFATGTTSAGLNLFAGASGYSQTQPEDQIFTVCTGSGNPSRLNNRVCYNKDLTQGDVTDYEVVNYKWLQEYVAGNQPPLPSNYVTTDTAQIITGQKRFQTNVFVENVGLSLTGTAYLRGQNSITADKHLYVGLDSNDSDGTHSLFRVEYYDAEKRAYYNKEVAEIVQPKEIVTKAYVDNAVANSGGGGGGSGNYVTLDTEQTITADKVFESKIDVDSLRVNSQEYHPVGVVYTPIGYDLVAGIDPLNLGTGVFITENSIGFGNCTDMDNFLNLTCYYGSTTIDFSQYATLRNCEIGTFIRAAEPEWEQDYATANYVNQKLQELYDSLNARISALESAVGVPVTARSMPVDFTQFTQVAKSKVTEVFEKFESDEEYSQLIKQTTPEDRKEIYQVLDDESKIKEILNRVKQRVEEQNTKQKSV